MATDPHAANDDAEPAKKPPLKAKPRIGESAASKPATLKNKITKQPSLPAMKTDAPPEADKSATQPLMDETMNLDPAEEDSPSVTMDVSSEDTADPTSKAPGLDAEPDSDP